MDQFSDVDPSRGAYHSRVSNTLRLDFVGRLDGARRTPQGGLRAPANLTRVGVLTYRNADGTERRELRPPEEVFAEDSLESLKLAPVTIGHPGVVGPSNYKALAVGVVGENVKPSGIFVRSDVLVQDGETVGRIDRRELEELSCGYQVRLDMTPGVWEGQPYDCVQRDIRYNHVGLGPKGWGRAGADVRLHLDGGQGAEDVAVSHYDSGSMTPEEQARLEAERDTLKARNAQLEADLAKARTDGARPSGGEGSGSAIPPRDPDPVEIDRRVLSRLDLLDSARVVLGAAYTGRVPEHRADGTTGERLASDLEVCVAIVKKVDPEFKADGRSPEYLRARADMTVEQVRRADGALARLNAASGSPSPDAATGETDSAKALAKARADFLAEQERACTNAAPAGATVKPKA